MSKFKLDFYLDYGMCFWSADGEDREWSAPGDYLPPMSAEARRQLRDFTLAYDAHYDYGVPPYDDWTIEDCKRFNREYRRILALLSTELHDRFTVCVLQDDLTDDADFLAEYYRDPHAYRAKVRARQEAETLPRS